jgi:hypothetical protein
LITHTFVNSKDWVKSQLILFFKYTVFGLLYICEICRSHSAVSDDSSRLCWRCVNVWVVPDVSNVGTTVLRNVGNHSLNDTAYYPRKYESSFYR